MTGISFGLAEMAPALHSVDAAFFTECSKSLWRPGRHTGFGRHRITYTVGRKERITSRQHCFPATRQPWCAAGRTCWIPSPIPRHHAQASSLWQPRIY